MSQRNFISTPLFRNCSYVAFLMPSFTPARGKSNMAILLICHNHVPRHLVAVVQSHSLANHVVLNAPHSDSTASHTILNKSIAACLTNRFNQTGAIIFRASYTKCQTRQDGFSSKVVRATKSFCELGPVLYSSHGLSLHLFDFILATILAIPSRNSNSKILLSFVSW